MKLGYKSIGFLVGMFIVSCGNASTNNIEEKESKSPAVTSEESKGEVAEPKDSIYIDSFFTDVAFTVAG